MARLHARMQVSRQSRTRRVTTSVAVLALALPAAVLAGGGSAAADDDDAPVFGAATIAADGAAVDLPVAFRCPAGWSGGVSLDLVQTGGNDRFASGYGGTEAVECTGDPQSLTVHVQVHTDRKNHPFRPGVASASGEVWAYDFSRDGLAAACLYYCASEVVGVVRGHEPRESSQSIDGTVRLRSE